MSTWVPITEDELSELIRVQLKDCTEEQRVFFASQRVPFFQAPIHRAGTVEAVFVIARYGAHVIYYEDVEGGFAVDALDDNGEILIQNCDQFDLRQVLHQLITESKQFRTVDPARPI
jgi:hypothetical protein